MIDDRPHERLWRVCKRLPDDYEGYGQKPRDRGEDWLPDCSGGCKHYFPLEGEARYDWGVCANPRSHRAGLLTFEHQGCEHFEQAADEEHDLFGGAATEEPPLDPSPR